MTIIMTFLKIVFVICLCIPISYLAIILISRLTQDIKKIQKKERGGAEKDEAENRTNEKMNFQSYKKL